MVLPHDSPRSGHSGHGGGRIAGPRLHPRRQPPQLHRCGHGAVLHPLVFVAKAEVKRWPIIGWGGNAVRTIWVDRSSPESRKATRVEVKKRIEDALSAIISRRHHLPRTGPARVQNGHVQDVRRGRVPHLPHRHGIPQPGSGLGRQRPLRAPCAPGLPPALRGCGPRFGEVHTATTWSNCASGCTWTSKACQEMRANWDAQKA